MAWSAVIPSIWKVYVPDGSPLPGSAVNVRTRVLVASTGTPPTSNWPPLISAAQPDGTLPSVRSTFSSRLPRLSRVRSIRTVSPVGTVTREYSVYIESPRSGRSIRVLSSAWPGEARTGASASATPAVKHIQCRGAMARSLLFIEFIERKRKETTRARPPEW
jgi:hypothetical protein